MLNLSQTKINDLSDEQLEQYKAYLRQQGAPEFEVSMISRTAKRDAGANAQSGKPGKVNPTLARLISSGLTKAKVKEQLGKFTARIIVTNNDTGEEVLNQPMAVKESGSSGNIMLGCNGAITLPGYSGSLQMSSSITASKSAELPE